MVANIELVNTHKSEKVLNYAGELNFCVVQSELNILDMKSDSEYYNILKGTFSGQTFLEMLKDRFSSECGLVVLPELSLSLNQFSEFEKDLRGYKGALIFVAGIEICLGEEIRKYKKNQSRCKLLWKAKPDDEFVYNIGVVVVRRKGKNHIYFFSKQNLEEKSEQIIADIDPQKEQVVFEFEDLRIFPFICADILKKNRSNASNKMISYNEQHPASKKILYLGLLHTHEKQGLHPLWEESLAFLLSNVQGENSIALLANNRFLSSEKNITGVYKNKYFNKGVRKSSSNMDAGTTASGLFYNCISNCKKDIYLGAASWDAEATKGYFLWQRMRSLDAAKKISNSTNMEPIVRRGIFSAAKKVNVYDEHSNDYGSKSIDEFSGIICPAYAEIGYGRKAAEYVVANKDSMFCLELRGEPGVGKSILIKSIYYELISSYEMEGVIFVDIGLIEKLISDCVGFSKTSLGSAFKKVLSYYLSDIVDKSQAIIMVDGVDNMSPIWLSIQDYLINALSDCEVRDYKCVIASRIYPTLPSIQVSKPRRFQRITNIWDVEYIYSGVFGSESKKRSVTNFISSGYSGVDEVYHTVSNKIGEDGVPLRILSLSISDVNGFIDPAMSMSVSLEDFAKQYLSRKAPGTVEKLFEDLAEKCFRWFVLDRVHKYQPSDILLRRLATQSMEMIFFLSAKYLCDKLIFAGKDISEQDEESFDIVYPDMINKYAKEIFCSGDQELNTLRIIDVWGSSSYNLRTFFAYLLGRVTDYGARKNAKKFLLEKKEELDGSDYKLSRTVYISLILLSEIQDSISIEYIDLLMASPVWDSYNRWFHLCYYGDIEDVKKDVVSESDPLVDMRRTFKKLSGSIESESKLSSLNAYTIFSLLIRRYSSGRLDFDVYNVDRVEGVLSRVKNNYRIDKRVKSYCSYVFDIIKNGYNVQFQLVDYIYKMKCRPRSGWISLDRNVEKSESIAEHTLSAVHLALFFLPETEDVRSDYPDYSKDLVIRMLLVHDFPEAYTGDIPSPFRMQDHSEREVEFVERLGVYREKDFPRCSDGIEVFSNFFMSLEKPWKEFLRKNTINSKIANDIDKIDQFVQLNIYNGLDSKAIHDYETWDARLRDFDCISTTFGRDLLYRFVDYLQVTEFSKFSKAYYWTADKYNVDS